MTADKFRSGQLVGVNSQSPDNELPDELPAAGSSGVRSLAVDMRWAGRTLGRYRVSSVLGHGGMAVVWRAHDSTLRRDVALKILSQHGGHDSEGGLNADLFMQEARAIAKLQHPSVVSIYEVAEDQGQVFLALELMEGGTLKEYVERFGRIPPRELWNMMVQPAKALAFAHRQEIIHRDIKPSNLMFDEHGHLKLMDFGLADVAREAASERIRGKAVGSFGWIAPETARGQGTTAASDIYSLGLIMLYALRGKPWLQAPSRTEFLELHRSPPPLDLSGIKGLTPRGAAILKTCLAVDPLDRYASAGRLADALLECADEDPSETAKRRKSHVRVALVAGVIGGLAVGAAAMAYFTYLFEQEGRMRQPAVRQQTDTAPPPPAVPLQAEAPADKPAAAPEKKIDQPVDRSRQRPWPRVMPDADLHFVANQADRLFHRADSECGRSIFASNLVTFSSLEDALRSGRTPCPECHPERTAPAVVAKPRVK